MIPKAIKNGAWEEVPPKSNQNGAWEEVPSIKEYIDGAWTETWCSFKPVYFIQNGVSLNGFEASNSNWMYGSAEGGSLQYLSEVTYAPTSAVTLEYTDGSKEGNIITKTIPTDIDVSKAHTLSATVSYGYNRIYNLYVE